MPYIPVFNSYIPGTPDGRPYLYDVEPLIREKDERLSDGATMIARAISGQFWQLVGDEAPDRVPSHIKPKPNEVIAPGAGNRVEKIEPWMPQFQLNDFLDRLDRELSDVSGLNDLLRGLAPSQVLGSSKAIASLVANYEMRMSMSRDLFYAWRRQVWDKVVQVWGAKEKRMRDIFEISSKLSVMAPSLTPRDDSEASMIASNMLGAKIWSQARAMDRMGVEDPESEQDTIREERTDAAMFPADVQAQAALVATFQQLAANSQQMGAAPPGSPAPGGQAPGEAPPGGATPEQLANGQLQQQGGGLTPPGMQGPGEQPLIPPGSMPSSAQEAALAALLGGGGPGGFQTGQGFNAVSQTMLKEGEPTNRLLLQQPLGPPPTGG
jgi:hypothetical protein